MSEQSPQSSWQAQADQEYAAWKAAQEQPAPATAQDIPLNALKDVFRIPANTIASIPGLMRIGSGNANEAAQMGIGLYEHYKNLVQHPVQSFYERPLGSILDVVAPLRGGAGVLKAAKIPGAATADAALAAVDPSAIAGRAVSRGAKRLGNWLDRASVRAESAALKPPQALERSEPRSTTGPTPDVEKIARAARDTGLIVTPRGVQSYLDKSKAIRGEKQQALQTQAQAGASVDAKRVARAGYAAANRVRQNTAGLPLQKIQAANAAVREFAENPTHREPSPLVPGKYRPGKLRVDKADQTKHDFYQQAKASFDLTKEDLPVDIVRRAMAKEIKRQMPNDIRAYDATISQRAPVNAAARQAMPRITNRAVVPASAFLGMLGGGLFNSLVNQGNFSHGMLPGLLLGGGLALVNSPTGASHLAQGLGRWSQTVPPLGTGVGAGLEAGGSAAAVFEEARRRALLDQLR